MANIYTTEQWNDFKKNVPKGYLGWAESLEYAAKNQDHQYLVTVFLEVLKKAQIDGERVYYERTMREIQRLRADNEKLMKEVDRLKDETRKLAATSSIRKETDLEGLYQYYMETQSYRKTGLHFGLAGKTVKKYLQMGGYIED